ncbi:MAG: ABC transporter substrate-binding protein [Clostridia bacterium]|nr:ABC transporter substrate-binding protein [Clostridia bacterium]
MLKRLTIKLTLVILILSMLLTLTACKKNKSTAVSAPINNVPVSYDAQIAEGTDLETIINNCFEGLVRIDKSGNITNGVATSWDISSDGLTYTFHLRNASWRVPSSAKDSLGEEFYNGINKTVVADDFAYAIKRAKDPITNAPGASYLNVVEDAYAKDDSTLIVKLSSPSEGFLTTLALPICMPCQESFFEECAGRYGLSTSLLMSNGPYYLGLFDEENGLVTLKKNADYEGDHPALYDTVRFYVKDEENPRNYDIMPVSADEAKKLDETYSTTRYKNGVKAFCLNASHEPFVTYKSIRLAFAQSTNVDALVADGQTRAEGIVPSCCNIQAGVSYRANANVISGPGYDMDAAAQAFKRVKNGEENVQTVSVGEGEDSREGEKKDVTEEFKLSLNLKLVCLEDDIPVIKQALQDWQKLFGVTLTLSLEPYATQDELDQVVRKGEYDIAYTTIITSQFLASDFLKQFTTDHPNNIIFLENQEYDRLINTTYKAKTKSELTEALITCETSLLNNGYIIPTITNDTYVAYNDNAKDVTLRPSGTVMAFYK